MIRGCPVLDWTELPHEGFTTFFLRREPFADTIHLRIGGIGSWYTFTEDDQLKEWMAKAGVDRLLLDKTVDLAYNFRNLIFDLTEQRITLPPTLPE